MRNSYTSSNNKSSTIASSLTLTSSSSSSSSSSSVNPSPSFARRRALKEADAANQLRVVDCYPLSKYLIITQRLFGYFEEAFECLHLDEAYVYGMRFAQLALTNLPQHPEWVTMVAAKTKAKAAGRNGGGEGMTEEEKLKSQIVKVLSRLEIIKRRMDEEESMKLRTRMLAQAEDEERRQNQYNRDRRERGAQEQRDILFDERKHHSPTIHHNNSSASQHSRSKSSAIPQQHIDTSMSGHTTENELNGLVVPTAKEMTTDKRKPALGKSAKSKLRQFLRIPKKIESKSKLKSHNNDIENSSLSSGGNSKNSSSQQQQQQQQQHVSQPIVPALSAIRQFRQQNRQQQEQQQSQQCQHSIIINNKAVGRTNDPGIVEPIPIPTHYTIEQYPIVNEVTLKLQSNQTPSLWKLQQSDHHSNNHTFMYGNTTITQQQKYHIVHEEEKEGVNKERTSSIHSPPSTVVVAESVLPLPLSSSQSLTLDGSVLDSVLCMSHTVESLRINSHTTNTVSSVGMMSDEEMEMTLSDAFDGIQQEASKDTDDAEEEEEVEEIVTSSLSSSSLIIESTDRVLVGITHRLRSNHREKDVNRHELVLKEMKEKISCMYVGHHDIVEQSFHNDDDDDEEDNDDDDDDDDRSIENDKKNAKIPEDNEKTTIFALDTDVVHPETDDVTSKKIKNHPATNNNNYYTTNNKDLCNSFDAFDQFLSKDRTQIDDEEEESYMEFTVIEEEEYTVIEEDHDNTELVEFTDRTEVLITEEEEEDTEEDGSYMEYTVIEEDVQATAHLEKVEAAKALLLDDLTGSPRCVTSDKVKHPYTRRSPSDQVHEQQRALLQNDENLDTFLTLSIAVSPAIFDGDDDMTYLTMDPYFEEK